MIEGRSGDPAGLRAASGAVTGQPLRTLVAPLHGATARPRAGTHEGVDSANEVVLVTEPALPPRSRIAAITGAARDVEIVATRWRQTAQ